MRIRDRESLGSSSSPPLLSSSESSSVTAPHSFASSQDSSTSRQFFPSTAAQEVSHRCPGLDLLVKAIHQVTAGSVIGVPYIQRRVTIRRRRRMRRLEFDATMIGRSPIVRKAAMKRKDKEKGHTVESSA